MASSSSSTLSPLAPPFTVDHRRALPPYSPHSTPLPTDLVAAEPFYPHYDGAPWNGPFDEGGASDAPPARRPSSPSWASGAAEGEVWAGARASAGGGAVSDVFSIENIWWSDQVDPYGRKYFRPDHQGWSQDKHPVQTVASVTCPINPPGPVFPQLDLSDASTNYMPSHASEALCDTISSMSHCYLDPTMQNGLYRGEEVGFCPATTFCPPANISQTISKNSSFAKKDMYLERPSSMGRVNSYQKYTQNRRHVPVSIREPDTTNAEVADNCMKSSDKRDNMVKNDTAPLYTEKESSLLQIEESQSSLHAKSDRVTPSFVETEHGLSNQNPDMVDQLNLAEDSPCWKGALASRQSPFHVLDTETTDAPRLIKETFEGTCPNDLISNPLLESHEGKNENLYTDDSRGGFQVTGCEDASLNEKESSYSIANYVSQNEVTSSVQVSKPAAMDASSYSSCPTGESTHGHISHVIKASEPNVLNDSTKCVDGHFLFRALHDLSVFSRSYCSNKNILCGSDYDLLSVARCNIDACLTKSGIIGEIGEFQYDSAKVEFPHTEENISTRNSKDRGITVIPKESPNSTIHCDNCGRFMLPSSGLYTSENHAVKGFENSLTEKFGVVEEDSESNPYKKLWIEAEAALCRMKYELHCVKAKIGQSSDQQKAIQGIAMQDPSVADEGTEKIRSMPSIASQPTVKKENESLHMIKELHTQNDLNLGNVADSTKHQQPVVINSVVDPSVIARLRVLVARSNAVDPLNALPPDTLHNLGATVNLDYGNLENSLKPLHNSDTGISEYGGAKSSLSCSDAELEIGMCFQPGPATLYTGRYPLANADTSETRHLEVPGICNNSHLMGSYQRQISLYDGSAGRDRPVGFNENMGDNGLLLDSYVPKNGWHLDKFQVGRKGSTSSDWEHVREEDTIW